MRRICLLIVALVMALPVMAADTPRLEDVMRMVGAYVVDFEQRMSRVIVEERYHQIVVPTRPRPCRTNDVRCALSAMASPPYVTLRSDLSLIKTGISSTWVQYRDVFEVNQLPVRRREERLARLLADPASANQLQGILDESARFNVGSVLRNINTPLFALQILRPDMQSRYRFRLARDTRSAPSQKSDGASFRMAVEVWTIEFTERQRPTLVRDERGRNLPASGRFWIEPDTGRVMMSELKFDRSGLRSSLTVSYQSEPVLDMLMPVEMREEYVQRQSETTTFGTAIYGKFRVLSQRGSAVVP